MQCRKMQQYFNCCLSLLLLERLRFGKSLKKDHKRREIGVDDPRRLTPMTDVNASLSGPDYYGYDGYKSMADVSLSEVFQGDGQSMSALGQRGHYLIDLLATPDTCLFHSILQVWNYDVDRIRSLDQRQIVDDVTTALYKGSVFLIHLIFFFTASRLRKSHMLTTYDNFSIISFVLLNR